MTRRSWARERLDYIHDELARRRRRAERMAFESLPTMAAVASRFHMSEAAFCRSMGFPPPGDISAHRREKPRPDRPDAAQRSVEVPAVDGRPPVSDLAIRTREHLARELDQSEAEAPPPRRPLPVRERKRLESRGQTIVDDFLPPP